MPRPIGRCRHRRGGTSAISAPIAPTASRPWTACCWSRPAARRRCASWWPGRNTRPKSTGPPMSSGWSMSPPADHPAFYAASRYTLNVTRADMIRAGYSPSVRLFEAAACGTPLISDRWEGIGTLFDPRREITLAETPEQVLAALRDRPEAARRSQASAARERVLAEHTAAHRAAELEAHLIEARERKTQLQPAAAVRRLVGS
ncbi:glycosyltransferase [Siccirubricoccus sp. G192]|uniref:glycosyltransferase family protein n=1 Tax=Siccirubricoccus sp. G192 TaxID=2849651 RepID=UPI0028111964|nr:glycosyltransferase [Siccirubricoccus sp. G192]